MPWLKNTKGKPDAMLSFATVAFAVVTLNLLLSSIGTIAVGTLTLTFTAMDPSTLTAYLGATFGSYVARRWTDKKPSQPDLDKTEPL